MPAAGNIAARKGTPEAGSPLPRVIHKGHNPFAWFGILQFIRWTDHLCPRCGLVFRRTYFPSVVLLGAGELYCDQCGSLFDSGLREWPELRTGQKLRFLFPPGILGMAGGVVLCGVIALFFVPRDKLNWPGIALIVTVTVGIAVVPVIVWCLVRVPAIRRSIERYEAGTVATRRRFGVGH